jgi:predicted DNA-binding transcriptional regulator YafY
MNRIDRVSAILIQLQSKKVIKAQHIADRFNISLRTVYRDIKSLEEAGIPVIGEAGVGYSLMDGFRLPPVMFTREEAISFLTAEKLVEELTDQTNGQNFKSAMYKVRAVLRSTEKDLLDTIDDQVAVLRGNKKTALEGNYTESILKSIAEKRSVSMGYFSNYKNEQTKRLVEPLGIFHLDNYWHLIGYCTLRNDYRDFRFDRIKELNITDIAQRQTHPPLKDYLENRFRERQLYPVSIAIDKYAEPYIGEQKYYMGFVSEIDKGDEKIMNFLSASLEGFARWFIVMGDHARIIEPETLRDKVRKLVKVISSKI